MMRQTPKNSGSWEGIRFTCDPVKECDVVIVLNRVPDTESVICSQDNVWALMQEPYIPGVFEWMVEGHDQYKHVFTHCIKGKFKRNKYIQCQPALPWHVNKSYDELRKAKIPEKKKSLSWITSNLTSFPGHKLRMEFLAHLQSWNIPIDVYGKGINFIEDKWVGLSPYRYSLAIENSTGPDYWSEKLADCFLSWTIPIYFGCTNLEDYFPAQSFVRIDIKQPEAALKTISALLASDNWEARLPALEEARNLVLDRYQFFPQMKSLLEQYYRPLPKKNLVLKPYRERVNYLRSLVRYFAHQNREV